MWGQNRTLRVFGLMRLFVLTDPIFILRRMIGLLFLGVVAGFCFGCSKPAPVVLTKEAYVWQRVRGMEVEESIRRAGVVLDGCYLQAALMTDGSEPKFQRFDAAWGAAGDTGKRVGMVIRIGATREGLSGSAKQVEVAAKLIGLLEADAKAAGTVCDEIQIDYDCPDSKLAGYAEFLRGLRVACPGTRIVFTALPSWLRQREFPELAKATGGYVLQVHSLELPKKEDAEAVICDVALARKAIGEAARIGVPFRVALPTYRSVILLDREGNRVDVVSEGEPPRIPEGGRAVPGEANARELAGLVAELTAKPPRGLTGIIWFRLPVETDRMNWSWQTFLAVSEGRVPRSQLEAVAEPQAEGYAKIEIRNAGEQSEPWPEALVIRWDEGQWKAADGLNGYRAEGPPTGDSAVRLVLEKPSIFALQPGHEVVAGWVRVEGAKELKISVEK